MNKELIIANNVLIAEFMGYNSNTEKVFKYDVIGAQWAAEGLKFHSNWQWLMPVIERISKIEIEGTRHFDDSLGVECEVWDTYYPRTFGMINSKTGEFMFRFNCHSVFCAPTLQEAAYMAVVSFVELDKEERKIAEHKPKTT